MKRICGLIVLTFAALGCVENASETTTPTEQKAGDAKGEEVTLDGLKSRVPSDWKMENPRSKLRAFQFRVPKATGDKEDAELVIFYFGPGSGGGVDENIQRWKSAFIPPEGKTIDEVSKIEKFKVGKVDVVSVDVRGTYKSKFPPNDPNAKEVRKADFRRFAIIFDSEKGPYFITLTGPAKTLEQNKTSFDNWLKAFK